MGESERDCVVLAAERSISVLEVCFPWAQILCDFFACDQHFAQGAENSGYKERTICSWRVLLGSPNNRAVAVFWDVPTYHSECPVV